MTENSRRQLRNGDARTLPEHNGLLYDIGQLTHVSWPVIGAKLFQGFAGNLIESPLRLQGKPGQEMLTEFGDILCSVLQRRKSNQNDIQAVVEILTKLTLLDLGREIAIRCRDDANVHGDRFGPAHPLELSFL